MKRLIISLLLVTIVPSLVIGQMQFSQYHLEGTLFNPAFAGTQDAIIVNGIGRQQWFGLTDSQNKNIAPMSIALNINAPIYALGSGLGLNLFFDQTGYDQSKGAKINYAYHVPLKNDKRMLSIGIGANLINHSIDFRKYILENPDDPLINSDQIESGLLEDFDFGFLYQDIEKFYFGISGTNLLETSARIGNILVGEKRMIFMTTGYYIGLNKDKARRLFLIPSLLVKTDLTKFQVEMNALFEYNHRFWAGVSYRYQDAVVLMAGINVGGFQIGLSYDKTISSLSNTTYGSPELFLGYRIPVTPKVKMSNLYNTRYL